MSDKNEMIVIRGVDYVRVPDEQGAWAYSIARHSQIPINGGELAVSMEVYQELIRGREFVNRNGDRVIVGIAGEAAEILGLEYEVWKNMERALGESCDRSARHASEANRLNHHVLWMEEYLRTVSFWTRLKWLFAGIGAPLLGTPQFDEADHPDPEKENCKCQ